MRAATEPKVRTCGCGRTFAMRKHERTGKAAPITTYEAENGNIHVNPNGTYRVIGTKEEYSGTRYLNHFTDCPIREAFGQKSKGW